VKKNRLARIAKESSFNKADSKLTFTLVMKLFKAQTEDASSEELCHLPLKAIALALSLGKEKLATESFDLFLRLGVDPKRGDQNIRGTCVLPHGTGTAVRVCVVASESMHEALREAGADVIGTEKVLEEAAKGNYDFDKILATTEMMRLLKTYARELGPMGLMPSQKGGTLVPEEKLQD